MKSVLVIAAHPDDEILGIGSMAARLSREGNRVNCVILGEGQASRFCKDEAGVSAIIEDLHCDTLKAAAIIGYENVYFENLPDNRFDSIDLLDVVKVVEAYIDQLKPQTIYTHWGEDLNVDHRVCNMAVLTATRPIDHSSPREIYAFETLSSTEWNFSAAFRPNVFINIEETIDQKLQALACYTSELREAPHPRSLDIVEIAARKWGSLVGMRYAEAFQLLRLYA